MYFLQIYLASTSVKKSLFRDFNAMISLFQLLLVTTSFAVGVGMVILSAWFYMTSSGFWLPGWLPVLAMCMCIFADAAGFQPISYIIITDLFTFQVGSSLIYLIIFDLNNERFKISIFNVLLL